MKHEQEQGMEASKQSLLTVQKELDVVQDELKQSHERLSESEKIHETEMTKLREKSKTLKQTLAHKYEATEVLKKEQEKNIVALQKVHDKRIEEVTNTLSNLEKRLLTKDKQIDALNVTSKLAKDEIDQYKVSLEKIAIEKDEVIQDKVDYKKALKISEERIAKLENKLARKEQSMTTLYGRDDSVDAMIAQADVMTYIRQGESKEVVAKKFGIPVKRVELIIKFDKIKKEK